MELTVNELLDRYKIKSRKSLYSRLEGLEITLFKDGNKSYATEEQIKLLDQQHQHIKNGGTIKSFVATSTVTVDNTGNNTRHSKDSNLDTASIIDTSKHIDRATTQHDKQHTTQTELLGEIIQSVTVAIASKLTPPDPLWYMNRLETARANNWELTTKQVKELIGVKPSCKKGEKTFKRGSFIFIKAGKIGNQTSWRVQKVTENSYKV